MATNEGWKDKEGNKQERTEWHTVIVWGKVGELCAEYLAKGRDVYVEGRIQTRSWEDKEGNKRYKTEVVANDVQFLGRKPEGQGQDTTQEAAKGKPAGAARQDRGRSRSRPQGRGATRAKTEGRGRQWEDTAGDTDYSEEIPF
jgi:single-strand DNA-binding protein